MTLGYFLIGYMYIAACTRIAILLNSPEFESCDQRRAAALLSAWGGILWPISIGAILISKAIRY
jgi:hypothetical protein